MGGADSRIVRGRCPVRHCPNLIFQRNGHTVRKTERLTALVCEISESFIAATGP